jgi:hypothetical protein
VSLFLKTSEDRDAIRIARRFLFQIPINAALGRSPRACTILENHKNHHPLFRPCAGRSANAEALNEAIQQSAQAAQQDNNFTNWETQPL